jgi:hypothetical protein
MKINNSQGQVKIGEITFRIPPGQSETEVKDVVSLGNSAQTDNISKLKNFAEEQQEKSGTSHKTALVIGGSLLAGAAIGGFGVALPMISFGLSAITAGLAGGYAGLAVSAMIVGAFATDNTPTYDGSTGLPLTPDQYNAGDFGLPRDPDDPKYGT